MFTVHMWWIDWRIHGVYGMKKFFDKQPWNYNKRGNINERIS